MKKYIPNFITCLNLFSGSIAVIMAYNANYKATLILILLAALFDFLDGFAARLLKAYSPMGKELDSLADVVSFGLAPAMVAYALLEASSWPFWVAYVGMIIVVFSALRLAKFNIDERQTDNFIGLATPANAIFWAGLGYSFSSLLVFQPVVIIVLIILFSLLLTSEIPMFSLKLKTLSWKANSWQWTLIGGAILLIAFFRLDAFAPIILLYIGLSLCRLMFKSNLK